MTTFHLFEFHLFEFHHWPLFFPAPLILFALLSSSVHVLGILDCFGLHRRADVTLFTAVSCAALAPWAWCSPHSTLLPCCNPAAGEQCGALLLAAVHRPAAACACRQTLTPPPEGADRSALPLVAVLDSLWDFKFQQTPPTCRRFLRGSSGFVRGSELGGGWDCLLARRLLADSAR